MATFWISALLLVIEGSMVLGSPMYRVDDYLGQDDNKQPESEIKLLDHEYGKINVRLMHVRRSGIRHDIREISVNTKLKLSETREYTHGDNRHVIATDSQKNMVYVMAKQHGLGEIEEFGQLLVDHFLLTYSQVVQAEIHIEETPWSRLRQNSERHSHAFMQNSRVIRTCRVVRYFNGTVDVTSGLRDLVILKTTKSEFQDFVSDEYRTLPDQADRVMRTNVAARWSYHSNVAVDFRQVWYAVKDSILESFAGDAVDGIQSLSVQNTVYEAGRRVLARVPQICEIHLELPNLHVFKVDFSRLPELGIAENEQVYEPSDTPYGYIQGTVGRRNHGETPRRHSDTSQLKLEFAMEL